MQTQELINLIDAMYPNATQVDDKIAFMNMAQHILSPYFGVIVENSTLVTVVDQDSYTYPTGLTDISQIISVIIENQATPDDRYDYTEYKQATDGVNPQSSYRYYQIINSSGAKKLCLYPAPDTAGLAIVIKFKKALTELSSSAAGLATTPDFDSRYHELLAIYACHMICTIGSSPDTIQADMFMQKWQTGLYNLWKFKMEQETKQKHKRKDNAWWHKSHSVNAGY